MSFSPTPQVLPKSYAAAAEILAGRPRKKVANNTWLEPRDGSIAIRLHDTDIVIFHPNGTATFDTGGWLTVLTKSRLNDALPNGLSLLSDGGRWYFAPRGHYDETGNRWVPSDRPRVPYVDGITLDLDTFEAVAGAISPETVKREDSENVKMRKLVNKYINTTTPEEIIRAFEDPAGDCWLCGGISPSTDEQGRPIPDDGHLRQHLEEHYVMLTLTRNAVEARGFTDTDRVLSTIYHDAKYGRVDHLYRDSLRKFLKDRLKVGATVAR